MNECSTGMPDRTGAWKWTCIVLSFLFAVDIVCGVSWNSGSIDSAGTSAMKLQLRNKVTEMFRHAYTNYMENAYPADELMPIACKGRIRGVTAMRGDVDDSLGNFSLTLIDTLDTLAVLGMHDEFEDAVKKLESDVRFDANLIVSVFETNIRVLGGLLGGHSVALEIQQEHGRMKWYNGSLLRMAKEVGDRLLPAFNTTTGIPMSRVIPLLLGLEADDKTGISWFDSAAL